MLLRSVSAVILATVEGKETPRKREAAAMRLRSMLMYEGLSLHDAGIYGHPGKSFNMISSGWRKWPASGRIATLECDLIS